MEDYVEFNGDLVPFRVEDKSGSLRSISTAEVGTLVVEALIGAVHFPLAATIKAIVVVLGRTAMEISVELQDQRVAKRIQLRDVTARRVNDYLTRLSQDSAWDPRSEERRV